MRGPEGARGKVGRGGGATDPQPGLSLFPPAGSSETPIHRTPFSWGKRMEPHWLAPTRSQAPCQALPMHDFSELSQNSWRRTNCFDHFLNEEAETQRRKGTYPPLPSEWFVSENWSPTGVLNPHWWAGCRHDRLSLCPRAVSFPALESELSWGSLWAMGSDGGDSVLVPSLRFEEPVHTGAALHPPLNCSSKFNLKAFMSHCDPHPHCKYLPVQLWPGFWNFFSTRGPLDGHMSQSPAPLLQDTFSKFSLARTVSGRHPRGPVLLRSSPTRTQLEEAGSPLSRDGSLAGETAEQTRMKPGAPLPPAAASAEVG